MNGQPDPYRLLPAFTQALTEANSRQGRDGALSFGWNSPAGCFIQMYLKASRFVVVHYDAAGEITGMEVNLEQATRESPDLIAYLARGYSLSTGPQPPKPAGD